MERIFLPIEIKAREFHSKILFSLFAAEHGFEVILGGQSELYESLQKFGRGLYIDKSTAITRRDRFRYCRSLGNNLAAWNEEGLIYHSDDVYHTTRMDKEAFDQVDLFFAWGPHEAQTILSRYPDASARVFMTGNPRMDLLRPDIRRYCEYQVSEIKEKYGSIILINTNFALYNFFKGLDGGIRVFDKYPITQQHDFKSKFYEFSQKGYEGFMEAIPEIRKAFPNHTIVIRPAPVENERPWIESFQNQKGTIVTKEGNAIEWIQAADVVVQFNCTTGVEAFFLGVPVIAYRCVCTEGFEVELPNACSIGAFSLEDLIEQLHLAIYETKGSSTQCLIPQNQKTLIDAYFSRSDNLTSCEHILETICARMKFHPPNVREDVSFLKKAWRNVLRYTRKANPEDMRYYREKFPGFTLPEVWDIAQRFMKAVNRFNEVKITSAGRNIVKITC